MSKLRTLLRAVIGLPTVHTLEGRPLPGAADGCKVVAVAHDRRLSAGVFRMPSKAKKAPPRYKIIAWRTYRDGRSHERATTTLFRDEIDPVLRLLQQCGDRLPSE